MTGLSYPYMANRQGDILSYYYTGNYVSHFDICTRADGLRRPVPVPPLGPVYMYTGLSSRDVVKAPADTSPLIVAGTYNHQAGDTYVQEGFLWRDTGGSGTYEYITSAESRDVHVMHSTSGGSALCRGFAQNTGVNYFEWSGGVSKPVELNDPAAAFTARNNRGDAIFSGGLEGPVLYTRGVAMPVSRLMTGQNGFVLRNASAINDLGQILCVGPVNNDPGSLDTLKLVKFADDENGDGFPDDWVKYYFGSYQYLYATTDSDGDGLTNREEFELGTDPTSADTDADGYTDSYEKTHGMNALVADVVRPGGMPFINEIVARNEGSHLTEGWPENRLDRALQSRKPVCGSQRLEALAGEQSPKERHFPAGPPSACSRRVFYAACRQRSSWRPCFRLGRSLSGWKRLFREIQHPG